MKLNFAVKVLFNLDISFTSYDLQVALHTSILMCKALLVFAEHSHDNSLSLTFIVDYES